MADMVIKHIVLIVSILYFSCNTKNDHQIHYQNSDLKKNLYFEFDTAGFYKRKYFTSSPCTEFGVSKSKININITWGKIDSCDFSYAHWNYLDMYGDINGNDSIRKYEKINVINYLRKNIHGVNYQMLEFTDRLNRDIFQARSIVNNNEYLLLSRIKR